MRQRDHRKNDLQKSSVDLRYSALPVLTESCSYLIVQKFTLTADSDTHGTGRLLTNTEARLDLAPPLRRRLLRPHARKGVDGASRQGQGPD